MIQVLYYVPVVHGVSDLGTLAPMIERKRREISPGDHWARHRGIVERFWEGIATYFQSMDAQNLKVYQDGMMTDGDLGLRIVREGAATGSRNYQVVLDLLNRGAILQKTEDVDLLKEEYRRIEELSRKQSRYENIAALLGYKVTGDDLLEKRDRFIADAISSTLTDGEKGVLFIGAFHDVLKYLDRVLMDIRKVKNPVRVRQYLHALITGPGSHDFETLVSYMTERPEGTEGT
jgi:hypothetical protein